MATALGTDGDALLAAILANPEEDTPRLIFADWLEEMGSTDRAEFIRVQIELARSNQLQPKHVGLLSREQHLLMLVNNQTREAIQREFDGRVWFDEWWFYRGFLERIECSAEDWFACADRMTAHCPIRRVRLTTFPEAIWGSPARMLAVRFLGYERTVTWGDVLHRRLLDERGRDIELCTMREASDSSVSDEAAVDYFESPHTHRHVLRALWPRIEWE